MTALSDAGPVLRVDERCCSGCGRPRLECRTPRDLFLSCCEACRSADGDTHEPSTRERLVRDVSDDLIGHGEAVFNEARTHRYLLIRTWEQHAKRLPWVMLNPSTADAFISDPTITRVQNFTRREGYGALAVVNAFGLRATNPAELRRHPDPVGERNDEFILDQCQPGWTVVAAWGAHGSLHDRARHVTALLLERGVNLVCLGVTKTGQPVHPLYQPANAPLVPYQPPT